MSVSYHAVAVLAPTERYEQLRAVWEACAAADLPVPDDVKEYFGWMAPDHPRGSVVDIDAEGWRDDTREGLTVYLPDLPPGTTHVKFMGPW